MNTIVPSSAPFAHNSNSVKRTMHLVMLALLPATIFGISIYGWPALLMFCITVLTAVLVEALCLFIAGRSLRFYLSDGSAILTGWLLAMSLPPWAPWWIAVLGATIAIVIGKQVFGGIGQNIFNPAMVARVILLISFPVEMTHWIIPQTALTTPAPDFFQSLAIIFTTSPGFDAVSGATVLGHLKTEISNHVPLSQALENTYAIKTSILGYTTGSLGETSALLIIIGGLFLILTKTITWHIPFFLLLTIAILASLFHWINPNHYANANVHIFNGATLLGAFFIATDLVTSPCTRLGQIIFAVGLGLLIFTIRTWANYPEGMGFAILLMNAMTPLIDHFIRPRIYGRNRKGQAQHYQQLEQKQSKLRH